MSNHIRPGVRGGRDQFSWEQVKEDKQRLNYLGSSIHGVPDKFKKGPETFWYAKETKSIPESKSVDKSEINAVKDKEKQMMEALLGEGTKLDRKKRNFQEPPKSNQEFPNNERHYSSRECDRNNFEHREQDHRQSNSRYHSTRSRSPYRRRSKSPDRRDNRNLHRKRCRSRSPRRMYK